MKIIDLRSDTVTQPTEEMRQAMYKAEVGDSVYGEDPTVNRLEELSAKLSGKEAALFVASGTMGNLVSLLTHCQRGDEAIIGHASHVALFEQCGASALGGISLRTVPNLANGRLSLSSIESVINPDNIHFARTKLICLENTWNGHPLPVSYIEEVCQLARSNNLKLHIDGAWIFNAAIALKTSVAQFVKNADSVQMCFSKGLSAPAGSIICADEAFIAQARRNRKLVGGGMRQVGVLAAACIVALEKMMNRIEEDHQSAKLLANELSQLPELEVIPAENRTNMVFFKVLLPGISNAQLVTELKEKCVAVSYEGMSGIRAVTHYGITIDDIHETINRIKNLLKELKSITKPNPKALQT